MSPVHTATIDTETWDAPASSNLSRREHPILRIRGKWLEQLGYKAKVKVQIVTQENGSLLITPVGNI